MNLKDLYQELIIDHNRNPRNHYAMSQATTQANGFNPLCGDKLTVYISLENNLIKDISFIGCGCAISQASASLMTEAVKGKILTEAHDLFHKFHSMLTEDGEIPNLATNKWAVMAGVRDYPARVKCATLAWHTLEAALQRDITTVVTE